MNNLHQFGNEAVTRIVRAMLAVTRPHHEVTEEFRPEFGDRYQVVYQLSYGLLLAVEIDYLFYHRTDPKGFFVRLVLLTNSRKLNRIVLANTPDRPLKRAPPQSHPLIRISVNHRLDNWITTFRRTQRGSGTFPTDYSFCRASALSWKMLQAANQAAKAELQYDFDEHLTRLQALPGAV
ncbi:MAG: hypothetical protein INF43_04395 [Alphaproteobacteria bacterium]|jgi:hypothetical protein|nr:hypothetical protein [Alphaproteobacteria bacterium]